MKKFLLLVLSLSVLGLASIANSQTIRIGTEGAIHGIILIQQEILKV